MGRRGGNFGGFQNHQHNRNRKSNRRNVPYGGKKQMKSRKKIKPSAKEKKRKQRRKNDVIRHVVRNRARELNMRQEIGGDDLLFQEVYGRFMHRQSRYIDHFFYWLEQWLIRVVPNFWLVRGLDYLRQWIMWLILILWEPLKTNLTFVLLCYHLLHVAAAYGVTGEWLMNGVIISFVLTSFLVLDYWYFYGFVIPWHVYRDCITLRILWAVLGFIYWCVRAILVCIRWCALRIGCMYWFLWDMCNPKKYFNPEEDDQYDQTSCSICMEDYEEGERICELSCGHKFHPECVRPWVLVKQTCPLCRTFVPPSSLVG